MRYPHDCPVVLRSGMIPVNGLCPIEEMRDVLLFELEGAKSHWFCKGDYCEEEHF